MNYHNEDELMERYVDALMRDNNAPVPNGLDPDLAAFTRKLVLSQATQDQKTQPFTIKSTTRPVQITLLATERREMPKIMTRPRGSYLTAMAAGLIMVVFAALLWAALNRKNEASQPGNTYTPATQNINITVTVNVTASTQNTACSAGVDKPAPKIEVDATALEKDEEGFAEQFAPQLLDYLNTVGSADRLAAQLNTLTGESNLNSQVFTLDISGDKTPEVLILFPIALSENRFAGGLFVFSCENGSYVTSDFTDISGFRLGADGSPLADVVGSYPQIIAIEDMNNDGIPEIVYSYLWQRDDVASAAQTFDIYQWDGKTLVNLTAANATPMIQAIHAKADVHNTNADSNPELIIDSNATLTADQRDAFERNWQQVWGWDGKAFSLLCKHATDSPVYRIQAINDGDDYSSCGLYDQAAASYQKAIFDTKLKDQESDERQLLEAYARYRVILLHVVRKELKEAQTDFNILQAKFADGVPGYAYAQLAKAFWDSYSADKDTATACQDATSYATAHSKPVIAPLKSLLPASELLGTGSDVVTTPNLICPFK